MSDGEPVNVFDYGAGRRVFQFRMGGGSFVIPGQYQSSTSSYLIGSAVYSRSTGTATPAQVIESQGCLVSYITDWVDARDGWIVSDIRYPDRLVC